MHCHSNLFILGLDARNAICRRGGLCWQFPGIWKTWKIGVFYLSHDSIWVRTTKRCGQLRINSKTAAPLGLLLGLGVGGAPWRVVQVTAGCGDAVAVCPALRCVNALGGNRSVRIALLDFFLAGHDVFWVHHTIEGMIDNSCLIANWPPLGNQLQPSLKCTIIVVLSWFYLRGVVSRHRCSLCTNGALLGEYFIYFFTLGSRWF